MPAIVRLVHPAPALTVIALSAGLGAIIAGQAELEAPSRILLTTLAVAGSQILTGALNDWVDRGRDALVQPQKPIPAGELAPSTALVVAASGATLQFCASLPLGWLALALGAVAALSATAYNIWLSRSPLSVLPYVVSFGILPLWVAAGVGVSLERVVLAPLLVGPFAGAAHLANALRDFDADRIAGSRNLAQVLGRRATHTTAVALAIGVGLGVGVALFTDGRPPGAAIVVGTAGLASVALGTASPRLLWGGMLVAAACWTVAWALATG